MAIPQAEDPAIIFANGPACDFHQAEVAASIMGETVSLRADTEVGGPEGALDSLNELMMWNRCPRFRCRWSGDR